EGALIDALRDGPPAFAALDVTTVEPLPPGNPLLLLPNCLVTPHIGSATTETRTRMLRLAVENAVDMLEGRCPGGALNSEVLEC
ncbi:D-glycerate dehydrogenase, partial [Kribbella turkmenica]